MLIADETLSVEELPVTVEEAAVSENEESGDDGTSDTASASEYTSAVEFIEESEEEMNEIEEEEEIQERPFIRRYPARIREAKKILTYDTSGEPKIKRYSLYNINTQQQLQ